VFGAELRYYRTRAGLSQKDLASRAGSYFVAAEHGDMIRSQVLQLAFDRLLR
jgi:transcriptional regulator with XRE-family HTH domain